MKTMRVQRNGYPQDSLAARAEAPWVVTYGDDAREWSRYLNILDAEEAAETRVRAGWAHVAVWQAAHFDGDGGSGPVVTFTLDPSGIA